MKSHAVHWGEEPVPAIHSTYYIEPDAVIYSEACPVCGNPVYTDESVHHTQLGTIEHMRCSHGAKPRPAHMIDPTRRYAYA